MINLSKQKRERMLAFLDELRDKHGDDESVIVINEIENEINNKKYGLVWEEHQERVDEEIQSKIPIFTEILGKEIVTDKELPFNFLIEGDNLHSLYLLEKTHKNSIDMILIDPPYNTGHKDFMYDDSYLNLDDDFKHSKWLSFMEKRLRIMYKLLSPSGMIIMHIDENEVSQLKLLCDEIFGDENHIGEFIWKARSGKGGTNTFIATQHEYILCYARDINQVNFRQDKLITEKEKTENLRQWGQGVYRKDRPTMFFPIMIKDNEFYLPKEEEYERIFVDGKFNDDYINELKEKYEANGYEFILPYIGEEYGRWRKGFNGVQELIDNKRLVVAKDKDGRKVIKKIIPPDKESYSAIDSLILNCGSASTGTLQLKELFDNKKVFDTTKPVEIEKFLLKLGVYNKTNAVILDCFAGSGTTGNAVMELNNEDDGKRRFILCTNNENNICQDVTYEKLKRLILGYEFKGKKDKVLFEQKLTLSIIKNSKKLLDTIDRVVTENQDEYDKINTKLIDGVIKVIASKNYSGKTNGNSANLKYYKTDYIDRYSKEESHIITDELLTHMTEMVQLEHGVKIDNSQYIIILTDEEADKVINNKEKIEKCKKIYISSQVLLTRSEELILNELDTEIVIIPEYYFENELREVGEL